MIPQKVHFKDWKEIDFYRPTVIESLDRLGAINEECPEKSIQKKEQIVILCKVLQRPKTGSPHAAETGSAHDVTAFSALIRG